MQSEESKERQAKEKDIYQFPTSTESTTNLTRMIMTKVQSKY